MRTHVDPASGIVARPPRHERPAAAATGFLRGVFHAIAVAIQKGRRTGERRVPSSRGRRHDAGRDMPKSYSAAAIARYFLARQDPDDDDRITHLKLQKLCYYAQGVAIATRGAPMFGDPLEAWLHGPVVPTLYREYRDYGNGPIPLVEDLDEDEYDPADRMILDDVSTHYGQFSGWRLRQMTHAEPPWKEAYEQAMNRVITPAALRAFFADEIEAGYVEAYDEVSRGRPH